MVKFPIAIFIVAAQLLAPALACENLPRDLKTYLESSNEGFTFVKQTNLSEPIRSYFKRAVTFAEGDINGDGLEDYALIVNYKKTYVSVVVFLRSENGFNHHVIEEEDFGRFYRYDDVKTVMYPVTGRITGHDGEIELTNLGIYVGYELGNQGFVVYWKDNRFHRFRVSD